MEGTGPNGETHHAAYPFRDLPPQARIRAGHIAGILTELFDPTQAVADDPIRPLAEEIFAQPVYETVLEVVYLRHSVLLLPSLLMAPLKRIFDRGERFTSCNVGALVRICAGGSRPG